MNSFTKNRCSIVKGCCRNVIVVKSPAPMFSEAMFILKDELLCDESCDTSSILKQAEAAAGQYSSQLKSRKLCLSRLKPLLAPVLGILSALLANYILK